MNAIKCLFTLVLVYLAIELYIIAIIPYSKWFNIILYFHIFVSHATAQMAYSWHECFTLEHHNASLYIYCSDFQHTYKHEKFIVRSKYNLHFSTTTLLSLVLCTAHITFQHKDDNVYHFTFNSSCMPF